MTKFYVDIDLAKAEAEKRSQTFYSVSSDNREPSSLNERNLLDRVLGDSMAAALIGHPGGYYAEVSGGEPGNMYTGQLLVSPPNLLRMWYSFDGFLDLLWENFWSMGESDPDAYAALDFDDINLDYFLLTSELPSYNQDPYYTYENADGIFDLYNMYALNTLGYLETQISQASGGQYDAIRATCIDGRPQYEFINSTLYQAVTPQSVLYRPIVLSQERYDQLQPAPGSLVVKARCKDYENTIGIDPYAMSDVEREVYAAKVPLNDNGFEYPIREISIDVVKYNVYTGFSYFVKGLIVNESDYSIDLGNLYFNKSIEELVSEKSSGFEDFLSYALAHEIIESKIYFNVRIVFDVFVPDTTEESSRLALAQATSHAIMDYFNQYVFAEVSANSISEITYTETMTFWSTLISAPLVYFGSWAVKGTDKMLGKASIELIKAGEITRGQAIKQMLLQSFASMALSPIKEVFQEIIEDGFIEAVAENFADMLGWTEDAGFWLSSFFTSVRETTGALGQLALGDASVAFGDANLKTKLSLISARISGDANAIAEITASVQQNVEQKQADAEAKRQQMKSWQKLFSSGFFKGLLMVLPAVLYGSFSFAALKGINNMIESTESAVPKAYARYRSEVQAYRKGKLIEWVGTQDAFSNNLQEYMKKPAELDSAKADIDEKFKAPQPLVAILSSTNPDPKSKQTQRTNLFNTFKNIDSSHLPSSVGLDTFKDQMVTKELQDTVSNQKAVKRMAEWKQELHESIVAQKESLGSGLFETYYPAKEMSIMDMLAELKLDKARQMWSILVNGKKVDSDYFVITPSDDIKIIPRFAGASETSSGDAVKGMISGLEITIINSLKDSNHKIDHFLTQAAIDLIVNSWRDAEGALYNEAVFNFEKGPNRNIAHFALFRYLLLDKLKKCEVIKSNLYEDLNKIIGDIDGSLTRLKRSTEDLKFGFVPTDSNLALFHERINRELHSNLEGDELLDRLAEFAELFNLQYKIYGYNVKNPFYVKALETFYGWADVLGSERYGKILTFERAPSLSKLSEFYGTEQKFSQILDRLQQVVEIHPEPEGNIKEYLDNIKSIINSKIDSGGIKLSKTSKIELFKELETVSNDYLIKTNIHYDNEKTLEGFARKKNIPPQNAKFALMKRISYILGVDGLKLGDLSDFLFNDRSYLTNYFFSDIDNRPEYYTLEWMKNSILNSDTFDLSKFVKKAVIMEINKWISENHFTVPHLAEASEYHIEKYGKSCYIKEFRVYESICKVYIAHEQDPKPSGDKIKGLFETSSSITVSFTKSDGTMSIPDLLKVLSKTKQFESAESDIVKKGIYTKAIKEITDYLIYREEVVKAYINRKYIGSKPMQDLRELFEQDPGIKAFDVMMLLGRDLGTEPIFFDDLEQNIFEQTNRKGESFARQHIDPKKFWSLYVSRMFLTTRTYHGVYTNIRGQGTVSVLDQQICLEGMHMLMERGLRRRGHGVDGSISELDIKEVFTELGGGIMYTLRDGRTVHEWWKHGSSTGVSQAKSFGERLESFNRKIKFKCENKVDSAKLFIEKFQKTAYDRFWDQASKEAGIYYRLSRLRGRGLGKFLSIPDSDLMRRIFPEQMLLDDYL